MTVGLKQGTATRKGGQQTAAKILQAAHDMLASEPLVRFTLRNIAGKAGVSLANLQYYYPRREALIEAMMKDIDRRYRDACQSAISTQSASAPSEQIEAVLRFQLEDSTQTKTRQFFIQLWALLGSMDNFSGRYLEALYAYDLEILSKPIAALHSNLAKAEVRDRALLIASLVEGLMVLVGDTSKKRASTKRTVDLLFQTALNIALEPPQ